MEPSRVVFERLLETRLEAMLAKYFSDRGSGSSRQDRASTSSARSSGLTVKAEIILFFEPEDKSVTAVSWLQKIEVLGRDMAGTSMRRRATCKRGCVGRPESGMTTWTITRCRGRSGSRRWNKPSHGIRSMLI